MMFGQDPAGTKGIGVPDRVDCYRRLGNYAGKILNGAKPDEVMK